MAQVILIEDNRVLNDLISLNLTAYLSIDLIHRENATETIALLSILPDIDLVITSNKILNEQTAEILINYITVNKLKTSLIILGSNDKAQSDFIIPILNPKDWEQVIYYSTKILCLNQNMLKEKSLSQYSDIPVRYFFNLETVNCNVFIRIKNSPTEYQYIKRKQWLYFLLLSL